MEVSKILPEDFDGNFYFTNPSDEDFVGKWDGKEYHYPAKTSSRMVMLNQTPLEIQQIRKKFAKDLAEREFFKSDKYEFARKREGLKDDMGMITPRGQGMSHAGQYTMTDLTPYIQQCLIALPVGKAIVTEAPKINLEDKLRRDDDDELMTIVVKPGGDLIKEKKSLAKKASLE